jgi:hypothetical protein
MGLIDDDETDGAGRLGRADDSRMARRNGDDDETTIV